MNALLLFIFPFAAEIYPIDCTVASSSKVTFTILNAGLEVEGTIKVLDVQLHFDSKKLGKSYIRAVADASSISTGIDIRDKHLRRSDYLFTSRYPEIRLQSISFKKISRNKYTGEFDLTIKETKKRVSIPFVVTERKGLRSYSAEFEINRLDFGLGEKSMILDDIIKVSVALHELLH
jgi:polyisoprenoid-binding protein YceI